MFFRKKLTAAPAIFCGSRFTRDISFTYRMPAGMAGDVNRTHPVSIEPALVDATNPPTFTGQACVLDVTSHNVRYVGVVDDTALADIYGVVVRSYPMQQQSGGMASSFGNALVAVAQPVDVLKSGYIMVPVVGVPVKGGQVFVWAKPASGIHVPGGFEAVASAGNTIALPLNFYSFNGGPDANGICEVIIRA